MTCALCRSDKATIGRHLPRGWKRWDETVLCAACAKAQRRQIAVVLPIASPLGESWAALGAVLRESWALTTSAANWITTELYARDARRTPDATVLPKMPRIYLYPEARQRYPSLPAIALSTLIQQVEQTYRRQRYELLWRGARSLATYRYPVPLPLHRTQWQLAHPAGGAIIARLKILDRWWDLRLASGSAFARQRAHLEAILGGATIGATGAIYQQIAHVSDHRGTAAEALGRRVRVLLKLVVWVPRTVSRSDATAVLDLSTEASSLLVGRVHGQGIVLTIHADHVRRAIAAYEVRRARLAADLGVVRRWRASERAGMLTRLDDLGRRHRRAMRTWLQQAAAQVAQQASRQRIRQVVYDDSTDLFQRPFPWTALRLALAHAVEGQGIEWRHASGEVSAPPPASLAAVGNREGAR